MCSLIYSVTTFDVYLRHIDHGAHTVLSVLCEVSEVKWRVAKYGDPYSEFVLCI